jgi:hypothetical protein
VTVHRDKQEPPRRANGSISDAPRLVYTPHPGATPESEAQVLANVYGFILECVQRRKAAKAGDEGENSGGEEA